MTTSLASGLQRSRSTARGWALSRCVILTTLHATAGLKRRATPTQSCASLPPSVISCMSRCIIPFFSLFIPLVLSPWYVHHLCPGPLQYTGSTHDFHWRVGINALVQPTPLSTLSGTVTFFPNVSAAGVFTPIAWADRYGTISPAQAETFKSQVYVARDVMVAARWGGIAFAVVGLLAAVALFWVATKRRMALEAARNAQLAWYYEDHYAALMSANGGGIPLAPGIAMGAGLYSPPPVSLAGGLGTAGGAGMQSSLNGGLPGPGGVRAIAYGAGGGVEGFAGGGLFSPDNSSTVSSGTPGGAAFAGASSYGGAGQAFPVMPAPIPAQAGDMVATSPVMGRAGQNQRTGSFQVEDRRAGGAYSSTAGHF